MSWLKAPKGNDKELEYLGKAAGIVIVPAAGLYFLGSFLIESGWMSSLAEGVAIAGKAGAVGAGLGGGGYALLRYRHARWAKKNMKYIRIVPYRYTHSDKTEILEMIDQFGRMFRPRLKEKLAKGRVWFRYLIHCDEKGRIAFYLGFPEDRQTGVEQAIRNCYRNARISLIDPESLPLPKGNGYGGCMIPTERGKLRGLSFKYFGGHDEMSDVVSCMAPNTWIEVVFGPSWYKRMSREIRRASKSLEKSESQIDQNRLDGLKSRFTGKEKVFEVYVNVWSESPAADAVVQTLTNRISTMMRYHNDLRLRRTRRCPLFGIAPYPSPLLKRRAFLWTDRELANFAHLPEGPDRKEEEKYGMREHIYDRIPHLTDGQGRIGEEDFRKGVPIGRLLDPIEEDRLVYLIEKVMRKMGLIVGQIGSGKSALILMMIRELLIRRLGFTVIDPKAEAVWTILTYFRKLKILGEDLPEKIHYLDLASEQFSVGLNLLQRLPGQTERDVINYAIQVLQNAYPSESAFLKKYARPTIKALLRDREETHTILAIPEFLKKESPLRERIKRQLEQGSTEDRELKRDLDELEDKFGGHEVEPLLNRLRELTDNPITKRMFGQKKTSLDVLKWLEEGHAVLINTQGLTTEETRLVMGYMLVLYHHAAQKRKNTAENHYLFIDEAHQCQLPILHEQIIPKDRSKGLSLFLLTQFPEQFNERLKQTIQELAGTIVAFSSGDKTAKEIERITNGKLKEQDIKNLKELRAGVYTQNDRGEKVHFFIETDPPYVMDRNGNPTYYGEDEERIDRERNAAFQEALEELGYKWMARDCLSSKEVDREIADYLESLWSIGGEKDDRREEAHPKGFRKQRSGRGLKPVKEIHAYQAAREGQ